MTMKLFLATLVEPTNTTELYEWSSNELTQLFTTKIFSSIESATKWATGCVDAENASLRECGEDEEDLYRLIRTEDIDAGKILWWSTHSDIEDSCTEDTFCLRVVESVVDG